jgi:hypothetical protein
LKGLKGIKVNGREVTILPAALHLSDFSGPSRVVLDSNNQLTTMCLGFGLAYSSRDDVRWAFFHHLDRTSWLTLASFR